MHCAGSIDNTSWLSIGQDGIARFLHREVIAPPHFAPQL